MADKTEQESHKEALNKLFDIFYVDEETIFDSIKTSEDMAKLVFAIELALHTDGLGFENEPETKILTRGHNPFTDFTVYSILMNPNNRRFKSITFRFESDPFERMHRLRLNGDMEIVEYSCYDTDEVTEEPIGLTFSDSKLSKLLENFDECLSHYTIAKSSDGKTELRFSYE